MPATTAARCGVDDVPRVGVDGRRLLADRERLAGAVVDRAPPGRDLDRLAVLGDRHRGEPIVLRALQPGRPGERDDEDEREGGEQQADPVVRLPSARLALHLPSRTYVVVSGSAAWRPSFDCRGVLDPHAGGGARELGAQERVVGLQLGPLAAEPVELHVELEDEDVDGDDAGEQHADDDDPGDAAGEGRAATARPVPTAAARRCLRATLPCGDASTSV